MSPTEVRYLILDKKGIPKWILPKEKKWRRGDEGTSTKGRIEGRKKYDGEIHVIHKGLASGGDPITVEKNHIKKVKFVTVKVTNRKIHRLLFRILDIVFTEEGTKGLHFYHFGDLAWIENKLVKRILVVDNGSSNKLVLKATSRNIGWDQNNIQKIGYMNLVGFSGETSHVIGRLPCPSKLNLLKNGGYRCNLSMQNYTWKTFHVSPDDQIFVSVEKLNK